MSALEDYKAFSAAIRDLPRGPLLDAINDVVGSAEENLRAGIAFESEEYFSDIWANIRCNLCDGMGGDEVGEWFRSNGFPF